MERWQFRDLEKAYAAVSVEYDEPDYIMIIDGRCPVCRSPWVTPFPFCLACRFPLEE